MSKHEDIGTLILVFVALTLLMVKAHATIEVVKQLAG